MMRKYYALVALFVLVACADTGGIADSWIGRPIDDLIAAWGPPTGFFETEDGRKTASYSTARLVS